MQVRLLEPVRFWVAGQEIEAADEIAEAWIRDGIAEALDQTPPADPPAADTPKPPARSRKAAAT